MIFLLASWAPMDIDPWKGYGPDYTELNRMAQESIKRDYPSLWAKHGCESANWIPTDERCRDLTE